MSFGPAARVGQHFRVAILTVLGAAFIACQAPSQADVMDVAADGTLTIHNSAGVYRAVPSSTVFSSAAAPIHLPGTDIRTLLQAAAEKYALDPGLLTAVAWKESHFHSGAVSPKGAVGVMQLMNDTARKMGVDRFDLSQNIYGGAAYLRRMLDRYGSPSLALAAYNAGPKAVDAYHGIPPFEETQNYVRVIMAGTSQPIQYPAQSVLIINR